MLQLDQREGKHGCRLPSSLAQESRVSPSRDHTMMVQSVLGVAEDRVPDGRIDPVAIVLVDGPTLTRLLGAIPLLQECKHCLKLTYEMWCSNACFRAEDGWTPDD